MRLAKARRPNGESSEIRSRALKVRLWAFMVESFEYKQEKNVYAMSAWSNCGFGIVTSMKLRLIITLESVDRVGRGFDDRHRVTQEERCQEDHSG